MSEDQSSEQLPEAVFHAIATLIQRLVYIVEEECGVAPVDLLVMWYVDFFGAIDEKGRSVILRRTLAQMLTLKFRMTKSQITKILEALQDKGLVERPNLSREERLRLFKREDGPKLAVILTEDGCRKFDLFKERITARYDRWLSGLSSPARSTIKRVVVPLAVKTGNWIIKRYDPVILASAQRLTSDTAIETE